MTTKEKQGQLTPSVEVKLGDNKPKAAEQVRSDAREALSEQPELVSQVLTADKITPEHIDELANFFRYIFNNDWPDYSVCPPCDFTVPGGSRKSAKEVYGSEESISIEQMDNDPQLGCCDHCGADMQTFHDPQRLRELLAKKLEGEGIISFLRHPETDDVMGFSYGYGTTLQEAFEGEWSNAYVYMAEQDPAYGRDFDYMIECLNKVDEREFTPDMKMFLWNCVGLSKGARGRNNYLTVMSGLFNAVPEDKMDMSYVAEVLRGSSAHFHFKAAGAKDVPDFIQGDETMIVFRVGETRDAYNLPPDEYSALVREHKRRYREENPA